MELPWSCHGVATELTEVYELKEELKQVKTRVARDDDIETLQNEVRALKEQVSGQPSQSSSVPARIVHVSR